MGVKPAPARTHTVFPYLLPLCMNPPPPHHYYPTVHSFMTIIHSLPIISLSESHHDVSVSSFVVLRYILHLTSLSSIDSPLLHFAFVSDDTNHLLRLPALICLTLYTHLFPHHETRLGIYSTSSSIDRRRSSKHSIQS